MRVICFETPGALCCPSSGRPVRLHRIMLQRMRDSAQVLGATLPPDPLNNNPDEFPPFTCSEGEEDDETDAETHWREKHQKCVASNSMKRERRLCKQQSSVNWCECRSLDECVANQWECRADGMPLTSSECTCQPQGGRFLS